MKDTSRERASRRTTSPSSSTTASGGQQQRRSPFQVARDCQIARQVRPLVSWTQGERLRRLAYALRPLIDAGMDVHDIAAHLHAWHLDWRPAKPASYIVAELRYEAERPEVPLLPLDAESAPSGRAQAHPEWCAAVTQLAQQVEEHGLVERTDVDRALARRYAVWNPRRVIEHIKEFGEDDALDLFGWRHVAQATRLTSSSTMVTTTAW
ncbi:hypothetical protein [Streptomyces sp. TR06-5]|uniref:hypothetical protein n=1 Tax=Streptomyces sp. TR06-5 TaxID=3385976 RepID=UPI0039A2AD02